MDTQNNKKLLVVRDTNPKTKSRHNESVIFGNCFNFVVYTFFGVNDKMSDYKGNRGDRKIIKTIKTSQFIDKIHYSINWDKV